MSKNVLIYYEHPLDLVKQNNLEISRGYSKNNLGTTLKDIEK